MTIHVGLVSARQDLVDEVCRFAQGLGCAFDTTPASEDAVWFEVPYGTDNLLNVLTYVALSATKLGVEPSEPRCHVRYREGHAASEVTLTLRIAGLNIGTGEPPVL